MMIPILVPPSFRIPDPLFIPITILDLGPGSAFEFDQIIPDEHIPSHRKHRENPTKCSARWRPAPTRRAPRSPWPDM
ncbi:hypothetical protein EVAR_79455_1 [Eumeta japonica]|uniref:Uncharacterized protein n=1 Tax=Eumeta variegata TaxID=151549 RepID=A0A4C1UEL2_EUMVA|nr:hypothetical protein EVAR_79455_1 [Eumeta japonica]